MDRTYSIPDEVLELILLRLDSPISLIRAASTSKRWRRIVTAAGFLRRFASDQGQPNLVAGTYYSGGSTRPLFCVPSTLVDGSRLSLDFLQSSDDDDDVRPFDPVSWRIMDSRRSLLLLAFNDYDLHRPCLHMIVCELLTRRHHRITLPLVNHRTICTGPLFLDPDDAEAESGITLSIYRLVCVLPYLGPDHNRVVLFSSDGSWKECSVDWAKMEYLGHTKAFLFWYVWDSTVAAMDRRTAEFVTSKLPAAGSEDWDWERIIVASCRDGEPRIIINGDRRQCGALKFFARSQDGSEWALEKIIQLSDVLPGCDPSYFSSGLGWVRVTVVDMAIIMIDRGSWAYRLDIETMEAEQASKFAYRDVAFPCELPWPPAFHACSELINVV